MAGNDDVCAVMDEAAGAAAQKEGGRAESAPAASGDGSPPTLQATAATAPDAQDPTRLPQEYEAQLHGADGPTAPSAEDGADAAAASPPASGERMEPRVGETLFIVKEAQVDRVLDGTITLLLRPWPMKRLGRWFLATRGLVHGKMTLGRPFMITDADMWAAHEPRHQEGTVMRGRPGYNWAYPVSRPLRLKRISFDWTAGAIALCKYRPSIKRALDGGGEDPIEDADTPPGAAGGSEGRSTKVVRARYQPEVFCASHRRRRSDIPCFLLRTAKISGEAGRSSADGPPP